MAIVVTTLPVIGSVVTAIATPRPVRSGPPTG
ncbi:hypothetical protein BJ968_002721 [Kineococcus aurantiacus]|uniref:Uncharacterized protein n=1 Tax=Kineococcus aurantiacus TaxID=37633 RepID=A0A7Y9J1I5_9ACTN|nr:hypothetical protein [Kineococcus aurantiacus]